MPSNTAWNLESFVEALRVELDKAQDTLALKAINGRRMTYSVKDVNLDLQVFPVYDAGTVRFTTAQPGQGGASRMSIQLGSITDRLIMETTKDPMTEEDLPLDQVEGLDDETKQSLKKIGVESAKDLVRLEERNIDLKRATQKPLDYKGLAGLLSRSKRAKLVPQVLEVSLAQSAEGRALRIRGQNLAPIESRPGFPRAILDDQPVEVLASADTEIRLRLKEPPGETPAGVLRVAVDPVTIVQLRLAK